MKIIRRIVVRDNVEICLPCHILIFSNSKGKHGRPAGYSDSEAGRQAGRQAGNRAERLI
jgi:hypothetical protein